MKYVELHIMGLSFLPKFPLNVSNEVKTPQIHKNKEEEKTAVRVFSSI